MNVVRVGCSDHAPLMFPPTALMESCRQAGHDRTRSLRQTAFSGENSPSCEFQRESHGRHCCPEERQSRRKRERGGGGTLHAGYVQHRHLGEVFGRPTPRLPGLVHHDGTLALEQHTEPRETAATVERVICMVTQQDCSLSSLCRHVMALRNVRFNMRRSTSQIQSHSIYGSRDIPDAITCSATE